MGGHTRSHRQTSAELVGALSLASWAAPEMLLSPAQGSVEAAPRSAERWWQGSRSWVRVPQEHRGLAPKFLPASAMLGAAVPDLPWLTTTGTSSTLSPQWRPCPLVWGAQWCLRVQASCCSLLPPFPRVPPAHPSPARLVLQLCKDSFCRNDKAAALQQHHHRSHPLSPQEWKGL